MSGDILQTPDAPKPQGALDNYFKITARGSTVRQEVLLPPVLSRASARC